jgi:uncharacterized protein (TIGR02145 family)
MKFSKYILLVCMGALVQLSACKKESDVVNPDFPSPQDLQITTFKNTSGNNNGNVLQTQIVNTRLHYQINFYGSFLADSTPDQTYLISVHQDGNDTTAYFTLDSVSHKLQTAYLEVNGVKQNLVIRHEYIYGIDSAISISIYDYNWATNTGTLQYKCTYDKYDGIVYPHVGYSSFKNAGWGALVDIAGGFIVAEAVFYGTSVALLPVSAGAVLVGVLAVATKVAIVSAALYILTPNSNAALPDATNTQYPANTTVNNTTTNPTNNLPPNPCSNVYLFTQASMDAQGSIAVFGTNGGTPPYTFSLGFPLNFQQSQFFIGSYAAGNYDIVVRDANNCVTVNNKYLDPQNNTVTDIDGNVYDIVQIGSQRWLKQNLRTSRFSNGDAIYADVSCDSFYSKCKQMIPCWTYPNGNANNNYIYGKLYNGYAMIDTRGVCPAGWHVPSITDFAVLADYLGGDTIAGDKMKATDLWNTPNTNTNSSGFSAYPAGECKPTNLLLETSGYFSFGYGAIYWTTTLQNFTPNNLAYIVTLWHSEKDVNLETEFSPHADFKGDGLPIRCIEN